MKITVSIPVELWNEAQRAMPDAKPSHVVQEALAALIAEAEAAKA